jgi:uncharacterized protein with HEPN domain
MNPDMNPDDRVRLHHIADALKAAMGFTEGRSREDLDKDQMLAFALLHAIQIVGEAASKITAEFREQHPQIPWVLITGMRSSVGSHLFRHQSRHLVDDGHGVRS